MMISLVEGNHVNAGFAETGSSTGQTLLYSVSLSGEDGRMNNAGRLTADGGDDEAAEENDAG
jgi:hypothetical protein